MDCGEVAEVLVAYHFGTSTPAEQDAVDDHLVECAACLRAYLTLRRAEGRRVQESPSPEVKRRLRGEVEALFAAPAPAAAPVAALRPRASVFSRRIPLYQGAALAAVAAAVAVAVPRFVQRSASFDVREGAPSVDTSRARPASVSIY